MRGGMAVPPAPKAFGPGLLPRGQRGRRMAAGWGALFGRKSGEPASVSADSDAGALREHGVHGSDSLSSGFRAGGFRHAFAKAADAMALFDGEFVAGANPPWGRLFGRSEKECAGQPLSCFLPEADWGGGGIPNREVLGLKPDGSRLRLEATGHPIAWEGRSARMVIARDISERKAREDALSHSEATLRRGEGVLRTVLAHAPLAMLAWDKDGNFTMAEG